MAGICRHHAISGTIFYEWKDLALWGMKTGLVNKKVSSETAFRHKIARLKRLVAVQALALQVFREELGGGENRRREVAQTMILRGTPSSYPAEFTVSPAEHPTPHPALPRPDGLGPTSPRPVAVCVGWPSTIQPPEREGFMRYSAGRDGRSTGRVSIV